MKLTRVLFLLVAGALLGSCSSKEKKAENDSLQEIVSMVDAVDSAQHAQTAAQESTEEAQMESDKQLIVKVYETFVFGYSEADPSPYFTPRALQLLRNAYDYDCEDGNCYAYWILRTGAQDGDGQSNIISIDLVTPNVYAVKYVDMGQQGETRIVTLDGKIDDFHRVN